MSRRLPVLAIAGVLMSISTSYAASELPTMPMAIDADRAANTRWLNKPVLESRRVDGMENPAMWSHSGPGQMSFTTERAREGKQSIRLVSRTTLDKPNAVTGRPWAEANLRCKIAREDWTAYNRISIWVYPTMPGFKIGTVVIKILNDDKVPGMWTHGPMHYALVKPGQWNQIVWEIPHLQRDKVTAVEVTYRLQGNEPGAAGEVSFDWDKLEIQRVEADHFEGWAVAPNLIAFSHSGYEANAPKTAITNLATWTSPGNVSEFQLIDKASGKVVLSKPMGNVKSSLGEFQVMDFSECQTPGDYVLRVGKTTTPAFRIDQDIWRQTICKAINFFYCERCGDKIEGIHEVCHADWQARHAGKTLVINGGWHDAGDLSQGLINTGEATYAMFTLAESLKGTDPKLAQRLIDEAKWGLAWVHKTRFGDGFRVTWGTMDYWTDNQIGTNDDTFAEVRNSATDNAVGAAASAIAARLLKDSDATLATKSLQIAQADWQFAMEQLRNPNVEALGAATLA
ncbi:MAG: glycoside hydrolase family 9 protein, partial [Bacillota bacterium]